MGGWMNVNPIAPRDENWKYTNLAPLFRKKFSVNHSTNSTLEYAKITPYLLQDCWHMVMVDGVYQPDFSSSELQEFCEFYGDSFGYQNKEQVKIDFAQHKLAELNHENARSGVGIVVKKGIKLAKPLQLLFMTTQENSITHYQNYIELQENATADILEHYVTLYASLEYCNNIVNHIFCAKGAQLTHYKLQNESSKSYHIAGTHSTALVDANYTMHNFSLGALVTRNDIVANLNASHSSANLYGIYYPINNQHIDNHTQINHNHANTTSDELYKGIADDQGRAVFRGKVVVKEGAFHSDAAQANHNLLLSNDAEIDPQPVLEIYNDDVKCSHGATISDLNESEIFYLTSRGMSEQNARTILLYNFLSTLFCDLKHSQLVEQLKQLVLQKIARHEDITYLKEVIV